MPKTLLTVKTTRLYVEEKIGLIPKKKKFHLCLLILWSNGSTAS